MIACAKCKKPVMDMNHSRIVCGTCTVKAIEFLPNGLRLTFKCHNCETKQVVTLKQDVPRPVRKGFNLEPRNKG